MIKSMTGFCNKRLETKDFVASVEIKSLNSKFLDLSVRVPRSFSSNEQEIRNLVSSMLERGKVSLTVDLQLTDASETRIKYKPELFETYYQELKRLAQLVGASENDLFKIALQSPDVMASEENEELGNFWDQLKLLVEDCIHGCTEFRMAEGKNLQIQLEESIKVILNSKAHIADLDGPRMERMRLKIRGHMEEFIDKEKIDQNRFEQELIYFIEKLDISEEMVRLDSHLKYFIETLQLEDSIGKKLGFISQEIGREINTIGSKANDADIQKLVVLMKDELEKIKEQVLNVL
jgi:uncharacterized protein (TIGR00255 family)